MNIFRPNMLSRAIAPTNRRVLLSSPRRSFTSSYDRRVADDSKSSPFGSGPAPPRLPKEEQEIFERLQKESTGAFSTPRTPPKVNQSPDSQAAATSPQSSSNGQGEEDLFPHMREAMKPEFEGDTNPKTGEVGGPKNEPLRWGHQGDWSYNGRVTDF
ncbi:hypothetical protein TMatcc_001472 [Talaromyces marneffei ATCC 18224]|uniref:Succinate dehydrogenase assembly factor 4, mitochondrial n=1 Tax=Talaromyces marneffei (strain ATCC 18224 / CBS 334.59 / QM 7333) TaxID=441960 RepID=B6QGX7_TALMQ|nr:uncharacterized protein EYB26_007295 [Talaromyces marneffei]EEA22633.1 conserved hypothetical protein [Talaromyces marneffei ATCC 18224]QGA19606.1 hypothetical protein EYB26_007295 [Talaromyces marneffei]